MSRRPNGDAPALKPPTAQVLLRVDTPDQQSCEPGAPFPHGYSRPSVPRAPYSHSSSVGSLHPFHAQYAVAWFQSTQLIGWSSLPLTPALQLPPVFAAVQLPAATHAAYAFTVTSVFSMQNALTLTACTGFSSEAPVSDPI